MDLQIPGLVCIKCGKGFKTEFLLTRHSNRKIPCNRVIQCVKCNKVFKQLSDLSRHQNRKTPCVPELGGPNVKGVNFTCEFCGNAFSYKHTLKKHFDVCKIKKGGTPLLLKMMNDMKTSMLQLKNDMKMEMLAMKDEITRLKVDTETTDI